MVLGRLKLIKLGVQFRRTSVAVVEASIQMTIANDRLIDKMASASLAFRSVKIRVDLLTFPFGG